MNHTCLCYLSRSWYSFTDPEGTEVCEQVAQGCHAAVPDQKSNPRLISAVNMRRVLKKNPLPNYRGTRRRVRQETFYGRLNNVIRASSARHARGITERYEPIYQRRSACLHVAPEEVAAMICSIASRVAKSRGIVMHFRYRVRNNAFRSPIQRSCISWSHADQQSVDSR